MSSTTNSRDTILHAALQLFAERGYESVGINEITSLAGITKPTLYYFFENKEGVFKVILAENYRRFNDLLRMVCVYVPNQEFYYEDVYPVLIRLVETYFSYAKENTTFYLMVLALAYAPPTALTTILTKPYVTEQFQIVTNLFHEIAAAHLNLQGKEASCAHSLIATVNAAIGLWYQDSAPLDKESVKRIVHQFMHGIFA